MNNNSIMNSAFKDFIQREGTLHVYSPSTADFLKPDLGVVSLTFPELSKIISRKYTMTEITLMVRIASWKRGFEHTFKITLEILIRSAISVIHKFR